MKSSLPVLLSALLVPGAALAQSAQPNKETAETPAPSSSITDPTTVPEGQGASPSLAPLPSTEGETSDATIAAPTPQWESLFDPTTHQALDPSNPSNSGVASPLNDPFFQDPFFRRQAGPQGQSVFDPFAMMQQQMDEMRQMQEQMQRQFSMPGMSAQVYGFSSSGGGLEEQGDHYQINLDITGLEQGSTQLNVVGNQLVLQCSQEQRSNNTQGQAQSSFAFRNNIQQRWTLPNDADRDHVTADANGDHLTITIPRLANVPPNISVPIQ